MQILLWVIVLAPLAVYVVAALREPRVRTDAPAFFLAEGQLTPFEFANSSIAQGFQIASVSVFVAWGFFYGTAAFVNPVFWGVGIILFALALPRVLPHLRVDRTLHGFLGERYNSRTLQRVAAVVTLIGYMGTFAAELAWGSVALKLVVEDDRLILAIVVVMAAFMAYYVQRAGQLNALRTDQFQLIFSYAGFLSAAAAVLLILSGLGATQRSAGIVLTVALASLLTFMYLIIGRQLRNENRVPPSVGLGTTRYIKPLLRALLLVALVCLGVSLVRAAHQPLDFRTVASDRQLYSFEQGIWSLLSLALLPACWQFVDVTMWQRLSAVRFTGEPEEKRSILVGLRRFAFESPASWLFAVLLGIGLRYADIGITPDNVWTALGSIPVVFRDGLAALPSAAGVLLAGVFAAGIVGTMLSTADSMLMGTVLVLSYDVAHTARPPDLSTAEGSRRVRIGKIGVAVFVIIATVIVAAPTLLKTDVLPILLGAYAAQISLFASVLGAIVSNQRIPRAAVAIASVVAGFVGAGFATYTALGNTAWQLYAPLFALAASIPVYVIGALFARRAATEAPRAA